MIVRAEKDVKVNIDNGQEYPFLTPHKDYQVIGISFDSYRIIDDLDEPVLYPKDLFSIIDDNIPKHWIRDDGEDGDYYIDPPEFSEPGFYEDLFDGKQYAVKRYKRYLKLNGLKP